MRLTASIATAGGPADRAFTRAMGAATDLVAAGTRRLIVNGCYWAAGLEAQIPAATNVDLVGEFVPTAFGFKGDRQGVLPSDLR